jgi:PPOX class probable F420-dependent enzyme
MRRNEVEPFLLRSRQVLVATIEEDGRPQVTPVLAAYMDGHFRFTTPHETRKARNLERDPRVTLTVLGNNFWEWVSIDGKAELLRLPGSRELLRTVYERIAGKPHPDWEEYDAAMQEQDRVVVSIAVERVYPLTD